MLDLLLTLMFAVHLLAVDLAMAGPLIAVGLEWRGTRRNDPDAGPLARRLADCSWIAAVIGVGLGGGMGLIGWYLPLSDTSPDAWVPFWVWNHVFQRLPRVASELAVYWLCLGAYVWFWQHDCRGIEFCIERWRSWRRRT